jgi:hypothetical protein
LHSKKEPADSLTVPTNKWEWRQHKKRQYQRNIRIFLAVLAQLRVSYFSIAQLRGTAHAGRRVWHAGWAGGGGAEPGVRGVRRHARPRHHLARGRGTAHRPGPPLLTGTVATLHSLQIN